MKEYREYNFYRPSDVADFLNNEEDSIEMIEAEAESPFTFIKEVESEKSFYQIWYLEKQDIYALYVHEFNNGFHYTYWTCNTETVNNFIEKYKIF